MFSLVAAAAAMLLQVPPPATPPPQSAPPSQALEELLRRLAQERGEPTDDGSLEAPAGEPGPAGRKVLEPPRLTRSSDSVQVATAKGERRDLAYWDSRLDLEPGDEVRQGPRATTLLDFADGTHVRVDGRALWRMTTAVGASPRRIVFEELRRMAEFRLGRADLDTVLTLPGGNELACRQARVTVLDFDVRALEIRNGGPEPVVVRSPYLGARVIPLAAGQRVVLPVLPEPAAAVDHLTHEASVFDDARGRLKVEAPDEVVLAAAGDSIEMTGRGSIPGIVRACGARMVVRPGETMTLTRAPLGFPRPTERDE